MHARFHASSKGTVAAPGFAPDMKKLRILLADDHKLVREGLALLINSQPDMEVVGEVGDGSQILEVSRDLQPDVVVMDLSMPELNGLQAMALLKTEQPDAKVVVLTGHDEPDYLRQMCQAGARGYVLKSSPGEELTHAIRAAAGGGFHFDSTVAGKALAGQEKQASSESKSPSRELSKREKEVLLLLAWGYSNKEIASKLDLSVKTIETYKGNLRDKLGLSTRSQIVQYALQEGWFHQTDESTPVSL